MKKAFLVFCIVLMIGGLFCGCKKSASEILAADEQKLYEADQTLNNAKNRYNQMQDDINEYNNAKNKLGY